MTTQLNMLETKILSQKSNLFSNLLELKEKEDKWICNCRGFCKIHHKIYNWKKPISSEILNKSRSILGEPIIEESEAKGFKCQSCRNSFESPEGLETHLQTMHSKEILVDCSVHLIHGVYHFWTWAKKFEFCGNDNMYGDITLLCLCFTKLLCLNDFVEM